MKHRAFAPALGALAAIFVAAGVPSYASAADPSGIWAKEDGSAKMEVKKCGRGICSKIVWLRSPEDSRGRPLRDARNENTSMRDRPIMGLPLFINMVAINSSSWQGSVYNPEEGKIYNDVKVTLASRNQIVLKGCKAWLLCGEKMWTRSKLPPSVVKPEEQEPIEVKAPAPVEPDEPAPSRAKDDRGESAGRARGARSEGDAEASAVVEAAREPVAEPKAIATAPLTVGTPPAAAPVEARVSVAPKKMVKSASPNSAQQHNNVGSRPRYHRDQSRPAAALRRQRVEHDRDDQSRRRDGSHRARGHRGNVQSAAIEEEQAPPAPAPKPKAKPSTQSAEAAGPVSAAPRVVKPKPKPKEPEEVLPWLRPR